MPPRTLNADKGADAGPTDSPAVVGRGIGKGGKAASLRPPLAPGKGASKQATKRPMTDVARKMMPPAAVAPRRRRFKPGTIALREIKKHQKATGLYFQQKPFERLLQSTLYDLGAQRTITVKTTYKAKALLQHAMEAWLIGVLEDANLNGIHAHRITVGPKDTLLACRVRKDLDGVLAKSVIV